MQEQEEKQERFFNMRATPLEYKALKRAIWIYSQYVNMEFADGARGADLTVAMLHSMLLRAKRRQNCMICWECSQVEALALDRAIFGYIRLVDTKLPASADELPSQRRVSIFQRRSWADVDARSWLL